jgi:hypothetical protein
MRILGSAASRQRQHQACPRVSNASRMGSARLAAPEQQAGHGACCTRRAGCSEGARRGGGGGRPSKALAWPDRAGALRCAAEACARRARPRRATAMARATATLRGCRRASPRGCVASSKPSTEKARRRRRSRRHPRNAWWPTPASVAAHERTRHAAAEARLGVRLVLDDPVAPEGCAFRRGRVRPRQGAAARRAQRTSAAHGDGGAWFRRGGRGKDEPPACADRIRVAEGDAPRYRLAQTVRPAHASASLRACAGGAARCAWPVSLSFCFPISCSGCWLLRVARAAVSAARCCPSLR